MCIGTELVEGSSLKEKYKTFYNMHILELIELCTKSGFIYTGTAESEHALIIIPAGMIIVEMVPCEVAEGIRWSFAPVDDDLPHVAGLQAQIVQSHPETNTLVMQAVHKLCAPVSRPQTRVA